MKNYQHKEENDLQVNTEDQINNSEDPFYGLTEKEIMDIKISVINKFNDCDLLMKLCCEKMGLIPHKTTHSEFIQKFTELVVEASKYRKEFQEMYMSAESNTPNIKDIARKRRK